MSALFYTIDHEWLSINNDTITIGITAHAQSSLGEIVYVELPEVGDTFSKGDVFAVVESVKAASDVYAPIEGEVVEINSVLTDTPGLINDDPEQDGWFIKLQVSESLDMGEFMDAEKYTAILQEE